MRGTNSEVEASGEQSVSGGANTDASRRETETENTVTAQKETTEAVPKDSTNLDGKANNVADYIQSMKENKVIATKEHNESKVGKFVRRKLFRRVKFITMDDELDRNGNIAIVVMRGMGIHPAEGFLLGGT